MASMKTTIFILLGVWLLSIGIEFLKNMIDAELIPNFLSHLRNVIFRDTVHLHSEKYKDIKTGEYITRIYDLTRIMRDVMIYVMEFFYPTLVVTVSVIVYFMFIAKKIGFIVLISFLLLVLFGVYYGRKSIDLSSERER
jgi:ABC-type multidrug transport system fused ATPase/permease subunit